MTREELAEIQRCIIALESDAMPLGFEARELAHRGAERFRKVLQDAKITDTIPAPGPLPSSIPPSQETTA